jgi:hypothetical protein
MPRKIMLTGIYTDVLKAAEAIDGLRLVGIREEDIQISQGVPHSSRMLGRPHIHERIPWASIIGALIGLSVGFFLAYGTQWWFYAVRVGGRPYTSIPTSIIPLYEMTMLGLILGTFLNFLWKCGFPSTRPQYYDPIVNEGRIAVMTNIDMRYEEDVRRVLADKGAERIYEPERRPL